MRRAADAGLGIDDGAGEVLVVRDIATRMIAAVPTESRHTDQVVNALKRLFGRRKVKMAYGDVAPEFEAALNEMRIPLDHSWQTKRQFSCGKDQSGNHQHRVYGHAPCRTTSSILDVCPELCYAQLER